MPSATARDVRLYPPERLNHGLGPKDKRRAMTTAKATFEMVAKPESFFVTLENHRNRPRTLERKNGANGCGKGSVE